MTPAKRDELEYLRVALGELDALLAPEGTGYWDLATPGSALAIDDEVLQPLRTSHMIGHCLAMAEDQLRALSTLLTDHTGQHQFSFPMAAHNANVRSALESSSLAIWLLSPDDRGERLMRSLRSRQYELAHEKTLYLTLTESDLEDDPAARKANAKQRQRLMKSLQGQKLLVSQAAQRADLELGDLSPFPGFREVVGEASVAIGFRRSQGSGLWQAVSGLAHPSALRQINIADREIVHEEGDNLRVLFRASTTSVLAGVLAVLSHFKGALAFTKLRGSAS